MRWTDAGVNWLDSRLTKRHDTVINEAKDANVERVLCICCDPSDLILENQTKTLTIDALFTVGLHPHYATDANLSLVRQAVTHACSNKRCVAIGEAGLDYNRMLQPKQQQLRVFEEQLSWCNHYDLPLYLHQRDAFDDTLALIKTANVTRGIAHCFTDGVAEIRGFLDQGFYIGVTGWLCDERRNQSLIEALKYAPIERLILETDAPYLTPRDIRPRPKTSCNMSKYIPHIAEHLARLKRLSLEQVSEQTEKNFETLFLHSGAQELAQ